MLGRLGIRANGKTIFLPQSQGLAYRHCILIVWLYAVECHRLQQCWRLAYWNSVKKISQR